MSSKAKQSKTPASPVATESTTAPQKRKRGPLTEERKAELKAAREARALQAQSSAPKSVVVVEQSKLATARKRAKKDESSTVAVETAPVIVTKKARRKKQEVAVNLDSSAQQNIGNFQNFLLALSQTLDRLVTNASGDVILTTSRESGWDNEDIPQ